MHLGIPKNRAPDVVVAAGLTNGKGWVNVDSRTLLTPHANVWAIGDIAATGTPKAGVFAETAAQTVGANIIDLVRGKDAGEKGSGVHVWNSNGFSLTRNEVVDVRDGFYIQSSGNGTIRGNRARDLRYGLHYMFSDDTLFEDNVFENGAAGTALMYSKRIVFRRNAFVRNRGFASVGLLFKACDDVLAEDNLIADNARGIFLEGSYRNFSAATWWPRRTPASCSTIRAPKTVSRTAPSSATWRLST